MNENDPSPNAGQVLVLAPDEQLGNEITSAVAEAAAGAQVHVAHSLEEAQSMVVGLKPNLFVLDLDATYDLGQEFLYDLRTSHPNARAIILTARHFELQREQVSGLGAIHYLEKPFPHGDFVDLAGALLASAEGEEQKFAGTLSDLHIADIIQLKCIGGSSSALEFTGPKGEKARVYFENGQVRHATAPGKEGLAAFNEIVNWKGGKISELSGEQPPRTINLDWQVLLMEAVRNIDETADAAATRAKARRPASSGSPKVLVVDDSMMLLSFVSEILTDARYQVFSAGTAEEGLRAAAREKPDLILLDYVLPDMKGNEVSQRLLEDGRTAEVPVLYMSGFGSDLKPDEFVNRNVIGSLSKPFTSDLLLSTVSKHLPANEPEPIPAEPETPAMEPAPEPQAESPVAAEEGSFQPQPESAPPMWEPEPMADAPTGNIFGADESAMNITDQVETAPMPVSYEAGSTRGASEATYFCGDTTFFSLHWALQTIGREKLTGVLRCFWNKSPVELLAQQGKVVLVTTRDPEIYCPEAPITLVNVDGDRDRVGQAGAEGDRRAPVHHPGPGRPDPARPGPATGAASRPETFCPALDDETGPVRL